jgi:Ca2+-binding RTX toxin-like protein
MHVLSEPLRRRRSSLLPGFGLLFVLMLWAVPSGALAAEVRLAVDPFYGAEISYVAADGESNDLRVDHEDGTITLTDSGTGVALTDGDDEGGCEVTDSVARCPDADVEGLWLDVGDEDDKVTVDPAITELYAVISGRAGIDTLSGGGSSDDISGGDGDDQISGGDSTDWVNGGEGDDQISGGDSTDDISGADGDDQISGGAGGDFLGDGAGNDVIDGGDGNDRFYGDDGNDVFNGDDGDDYFNGYDYTGADNFNGGPGNDWLDYRRMRAITASLDNLANDGENCPGIDCEGDNAGADIENLSGGNGDDTLTGNDDANVLAGEPGSDTIHGLGGDDELVGDWGWSSDPFGAGNDIIDGGTGNDSLFGDFGADSLTGGPGVDGLDGDAGSDALNSADGGTRDSDGCGSGTDSVTGDTGDVVAGDCETVTGALVGGPAGPQGVPGPAGQPAPRGQRGLRTRPGRVVHARVTRRARHLRVRGVSTESGKVKVTVRKAGRVIGTAQRTVRAGRRFTLTIRVRRAVRSGRYTLTTTLRAADGHAWTATERVRIR